MRIASPAPGKAIKSIELVCDPDIQLRGLEPSYSPEDLWSDPDILEFMLQDNEGHKAWRNVFGRLGMDYGFELFKKAMLASPGKKFEHGLIKRAFLFKKVFDILKKDPITPIV